MPTYTAGTREYEVSESVADQASRVLRSRDLGHSWERIADHHGIAKITAIRLAAIACRLIGLDVTAIPRRLRMRRDPETVLRMAYQDRRRRLAWAVGTVAAATGATGTTPAGDQFARNFGVEIEFTGLSREDAAAAIVRSGLSARSEGYGHGVRAYWKIVHDASVRGSYENRGGEVVSPILNGESGFEAVKTVVRALRQAGATVDRTCGIHVHLEVEGLPGDALARIVQNWHAAQDQIDGLVGANRRRQHQGAYYCARLRDADVSSIVNELLMAQGRRRSLGWNRDDGRRYRALNVFSFVKYGTFEFRQHGGSLHAAKVVNWIKFCMGFTNTAVRQTAPMTTGSPATTAELLQVVADQGSLPNTTHRALARRAERLAGRAA